MLQRFVSLSKLERFTLVDFDNASLHPAVKWWGAKGGGGGRGRVAYHRLALQGYRLVVTSSYEIKRLEKLGLCAWFLFYIILLVQHVNCCLLNLFRKALWLSRMLITNSLYSSTPISSTWFKTRRKIYPHPLQFVRRTSPQASRLLTKKNAAYNDMKT